MPYKPGETLMKWIDLSRRLRESQERDDHRRVQSHLSAQDLKAKLEKESRIAENQEFIRGPKFRLNLFKTLSPYAEDIVTGEKKARLEEHKRKLEQLGEERKFDTTALTAPDATSVQKKVDELAEKLIYQGQPASKPAQIVPSGLQQQLQTLRQPTQLPSAGVDLEQKLRGKPIPSPALVVPGGLQQKLQTGIKLKPLTQEIVDEAIRQVGRDERAIAKWLTERGYRVQ